jgi:hypothetical protein
VTAQHGAGDPTTVGYEAEPQDVAAEIAGILDGWDDPLARYHATTAAQAHYQAVVNGLADERAWIAAAWNSPVARHSNSSNEAGNRGHAATSILLVRSDPVRQSHPAGRGRLPCRRAAVRGRNHPA